jgi:hypothetical protein
LALESPSQTQNITALPIFGSSAGGLQTRMRAPKAADAKVVTGAVAVQQSKRAREQQEAKRVTVEDSPSLVRRVDGKTFYLRDEVWTDSEFKANSSIPETVLRFASDDYFALLKQKPRLANFFALGERVLVVFEGRVYKVNAAAP